MERAYIPRLIDPVIARHLQAFGAVEVAGTMWSGKTWTSLEHAASSTSLDVPSERELAQLSPEAVLLGAKPRLIDEWQEVPTIWDVIRHSVDDAAGERGLYLLTGSSRPSHGETHHSGSGRISRLRMWPMTLFEMGHSSGQVSLSGLFDRGLEPLKSLETKTDLRDLAEYIVRGGWPDAVHLEKDVAELIPTQYVDTLLASQDRSAPDSPNDLRRFLRSLARNLGSSVKIDTLVADMGYEVEGEITETGRRKIRALLQYFIDRFVIDRLEGWDAPIKSPQRLRTKPRYGFADPSLPAALLGMNDDSLMKNMQVFGQLFEQLCMRDLQVYASVMQAAGEGSLRFYRDADGLEVDAILELRDGRWAGIEIKLGWNKVAQAEESLLRLKRKVAANPSAQNPEPSFLMVLVGVSDRAYTTNSGVHVVPITALAP